MSNSDFTCLERVQKSQETMSAPLSSFQSRPLHKIEIIVTTTNPRKVFQDGTAVVRSSVWQRYSGRKGESREQYGINKV